MTTSLTDPLHRRRSVHLGFTAPAALIATAFVALLTAPARADHIDDQLLVDVPRIVNYLKDHGVHTVGVVKFSVKKGDQPASYNAGTLNLKMALKLEHALVMANDSKQPIAILQDVTTEGSQSRGGLADSQGRRALLDHAYPVAWGNDKKKPEMLLTGEVQFTKDMKTLAIAIRSFDPKKPDRLEDVLRLTGIKTDRDILASAGQSFVLSRKVQGRGADDLAADDAAKRDENPKDNPLQSPDDPIKFEVTYDGKPVTLDPDQNSPGELKAKRSNTSQNAKEGEKVSFKITNSSKDKVGVVLAINARNTLFQEDLTQKAPGACSKWILDPGESYTIDGFYMSQDGKSVFPFRVLSDEESAKVEMVPEHKGVFSVYVFREGSGQTAMNIELARKVREKSMSAAEAKENLKKVFQVKESNGKLLSDPGTRSHSTSTKNVKRAGHRGLIVGGGESGEGSQLKELQLKWDPEPVMCLFIRYYSDAAASQAAGQ